MFINKKINLINRDHNLTFKINTGLNPLIKTVYNHILYYPTPLNLNYNWSFGSLSGLFFVFQIISGVFLAMHYIPNVELAFWSVEHIMRDVHYGWLLRYAHSNGASFIFIFIYCHILKGIYFRSYLPGTSKNILFSVGVIIFILMMGTAFIGYVLPWGQMSLWGATVITSLITAIPLIGNTIAYVVWGGYSVGNATLNRFFSIHFILPFIIIGIVFLHLLLLHIKGSTNALGIVSNRDKISFHPYFTIKDLFSFFLASFGFFLIVCFYPNLLGHPDNYIMANSLVTPAHIVPEWYFLPFYAILRAIPDKVGGVLAMFFSIIILIFLPFLDKSPLKGPNFKFFLKFFFIIFVSNFIFLGFLGGSPAEEPFIFFSRVCSILYFFYFILIIPIFTRIEFNIVY